MNPTQRFRKLAFAQVVLGLLAFFIAERNPGMLMIVGALAILSWYVVEGPRGRPLPRVVTNIAAIAAVGWLLVEFSQNPNTLPIVPLAHFIAWLQLILLYSKKNNTQYGELLVLSLLQMVGAGAINQHVLFGFLLVLYCVLALVTVVLFQLKTSTENVMEANRQAAPRGADTSRPKHVTCRGYRWQFRLTTVLIGAVALVVGMAVFLLAPRNPAIASRMGMGLSGGEAGFAPRVDLKGTPPWIGNREIVMTMDVTRDGQAADPGQPMLVRGVALDFYDPYSQSWSRGYNYAYHDVEIELGGRPQLQLLPESDQPPITAEITLRSTSENILFSPWPPSAFATSGIEALRFGYTDQRLAAASPLTGPLVYTVEARPNWSPGLLAEYHQTLQAHNPQIKLSDSDVNGADNYSRTWGVETAAVRKLAQQIIGQAGLTRDPDKDHAPQDAAVVAALAKHLRSSFTYSLQNAAEGSHQDAVVSFLFDRQAGHCELFAGGLVALARSLGIPARVVSGYMASDYNTLGGYYVIRKNHAHAWIEAELAPGMWASFDATPSAAVAAEHARPGGPLAYLRDLYEYTESGWMRLFIAYNEHNRRAVLDSVNDAVGDATGLEGNVFQQAIRWITELPKRLRFDPGVFAIVVMICFFIVLGIASLTRTLMLRRRRLVALQLTRLPRQQRRGLAKQLRFYLIMLDMLERHGYHRPLWQSPFDFAKRIASGEPSRLQPVVGLTEHFYEIRFGHRGLDDNRQQSIKNQLRQLENNLIQTA